MDLKDLIETCFQEHNTYRSLHGVDELIHSINLDKSAQKWAETLISKNISQKSPISIKGEVGENISWQSKSTLSGTVVAKEWYANFKNYNFDKVCGDADDFTQMIWKSTKEVGFGMAQSKDRCVVVGHYKPAGNTKGQYLANVIPMVSPNDDLGSAGGKTTSVNGALDEAFGQGIRPYIDIIDNLRRYGLQQYVELPNVVVVGDQSSGKSSIIELISGIQLPRGTGIVTRCPLELQLKKVVDQPWNATITFKSKLNDDVTKTTSDPQEVEHLVSEAQDDLCGTKKGVSKELITLRIESPEENAPDLTMIDLPGISRIAIEDQPLDICDQIKDMIMSHVKSNNTVILCVISGDLDIAVNESINIARTVDPNGLRTIGVITKPDIADLDHKMEVLKMLENKKIDLKKGFNLVKCRSLEQLRNKLPLSEFLNTEMEFYENDEIYKEADITKLGALNLSRKITQELVDVIKNNLPVLQNKIESLLEQCETELKTLPKNIPLSDEGKRSYLMNIAMDFNEQIKLFLLKGEKGDHKERINSYCDWRAHFNYFQTAMDSKQRGTMKKEFSLSNLNKKIIDYRGKEISGFLSFTLFEELMINYVQSCKVYANQLIASMRNDIKNRLGKIMTSLISHLPGIESDLHKILNSESEAILKVAEERIDFIFKQETLVFTMDRAFDNEWDKYNKKIESERSAALATLSTPTVTDSGTRMLNCITFYLEIVHTRLCDYVPMAVMQCLLIQHQADLKIRVSNYLSNNETIAKCHESQSISTRRSKLTNKISCLKKGKNELENKYNFFN